MTKKPIKFNEQPTVTQLEKDSDNAWFTVAPVVGRDNAVAEARKFYTKQLGHGRFQLTNAYSVRTRGTARGTWRVGFKLTDSVYKLKGSEVDEACPKCSSTKIGGGSANGMFCSECCHTWGASTACPSTPCDRCEENEVEIKISATDVDGTVLDYEKVCRQCAVDAGFEVGRRVSK